ncbi:MAG: hypothetical protein HYR55_07305 [Acidobacteria bacterium]|nr:hypothetical protein [Acidobacteriota bacterium]MBI3658025.1 hypothetical protein [Acidobacteriota bacterium]
MDRWARHFRRSAYWVAATFTLIFLGSPIVARDLTSALSDTPGPQSFCKIDPNDVHRELLRYEQVKDRLNKGLVPAITADRDVNDVAVIEDDGTIILAPNNFDFPNRTIRFSPTPNGYNLTHITPTFDGNFGTPARMRDDDTRNIPLGFTFPFYNRSYDNLWLNSDGNITFTVGDVSDERREALRHLLGPPRISPLFQDLNPEDAGVPPDGGVFYRIDGDRAVFTWNKIPLYHRDGQPLQFNSFQAVLYSSGVIDFSYATMEVVGSSAPFATVGLSPGGVTEGRTLSFSRDLPLTDVAGAFYEEFRAVELLSFIGLVRKFYQTHPDTFDFVIAFTNFSIDGGGAFAAKYNIANYIKGLGYRNLLGTDTFDRSLLYGSLGRLSAFLFMFGEDQYPSDPTRLIPGLGTNNTLTVLGQEVGHRWGAFTKFLKDGQPDDQLLGRDKAHWSFFYNSFASVLEGNEWSDNGGGTFTTINATARYSQLDQYLMGLRLKEEVAPSFVIANPSSVFTRGSAPFIGANARGIRMNVSIDEIIAAEGPRVPDAAHSQKTFTGAFLLLTKNGVTPTQATLEKLARIRQGWENFFGQATEGRGQFFTGVAGPAPEGGTATVLNFPYWEQSAESYTGLAITNRSNQIPATLRMTAYDNEGRPINLPGIQNAKTFAILPQMQLARFAGDVFALPGSPPVDGWIQASVSNNEISSFFLAAKLQGAQTTALDGAGVDNEVSNTLVFTRIIEGRYLNQEVATELYVVNPNEETANVALNIYGAVGGAPLATVNRTIPGHGRIAGGVRSIFSGAPFPLVGGHVEVSGTLPLVGFELTRYGREISSLSAQVPNNAVRLYSAHYAHGDIGVPWFTELNLANTTMAPINVTLRLVGNNGQPIAGPGIVNPVNRVVPMKGNLIGTLTSLFGFPSQPDPSVRTGSIIIEAGAPGLSGDVLFGEPTSAAVMSDLPLTSRLVTEAVFSQVAQGLGFFTGVAVMNPNANPITLTISVYAASGLLTGRRSLIMGGGTRFAEMLDQLVPEAAAQIGGYITVRSEGGGVALFEIFGDLSSTTFNSAVPPQVVRYVP